MSKIFPEPIKLLPEANISIDGARAYISQSKSHQILFMEFEKDTVLPEHSHESQFGIVLEGKIDLILNGIKNTYSKGESYFIPKDVKHSAKIYAGYADVSFFNEPDRYKAKE